jgi:hypothetical protein
MSVFTEEINPDLFDIDLVQGAREHMMMLLVVPTIIANSFDTDQLVEEAFPATLSAGIPLKEERWGASSAAVRRSPKTGRIYL